MIVVAAVLLSKDSSERSSAVPPPVHAGAVDRTTVYHSPQTPGYTAWVGAWLMPDDSHDDRASCRPPGPLDPAQRPRTPAAVDKLFDTGARPRPTARLLGPEAHEPVPALARRGQEWTPDRTERFRAIGPYGYTVTGHHRAQGRDHHPADQRRRPAPGPSRSRTPRSCSGWRRGPSAGASPQVLLDPQEAARTSSPASATCAMAGWWPRATLWDVPADTPLRVRTRSPRQVPADDLGRRRAQLAQRARDPAGRRRPTGWEWDTGELPSGDLAAILRVKESQQDTRKQALLERTGDGS